MNILAIESSSLAASAAIISGGKVTAEYTVNFRKTHSQTLLPMTDEIVKMTGFNLQELDAVAVSAGPGSFTGLRIGAAQAKGLAFALDKPMVAVPTLHALAYNCFGSQYIICPMMDARRQQVYTGLFEFCDGGMVIHMDSSALSVEEIIMAARELSEKLNRKVMYLGDGVPVYREKILELDPRAVFAIPSQNDQRASSVAALAEVMYRRGEITDAFSFVPIYLRKSQAEREREKAGLPTE